MSGEFKLIKVLNCLLSGNVDKLKEGIEIVNNLNDIEISSIEKKSKILTKKINKKIKDLDKNK